MSSSTSSSFLKVSVDDLNLSTDEIIVSSASSSLESESEWESEVEDEVFLPNDYRFDGSDPMVIPPPIQQVPSSTATASGMMVLAAAAAVASPMSSMGGGASDSGGESPLAWPLPESPAANGEGDAAATAASGEGDAATTVVWPVGESALMAVYGESCAVVVNSAPTIPTATSAASTWPIHKENGKTFAVLIPPMEGSWLWEAYGTTYTGANAGVPTATDAPMSMIPPANIFAWPQSRTPVKIDSLGSVDTPVSAADVPMSIPPVNIFAWPRSSSEDTSIPPAKIFKWSTDAGAPTAGATLYYTPRSPTEITSPSPPRGPRFSPISPPDTANSMDGSYAAGMWLSSVCLSVCLSVKHVHLSVIHSHMSIVSACLYVCLARTIHTC